MWILASTLMSAHYYVSQQYMQILFVIANTLFGASFYMSTWLHRSTLHEMITAMHKNCH